MPDRSPYNLSFPAEGIDQYCPGGYHPIHLNDVLKDGQYEILHKLGFGAFATVWLARDKLYAILSPISSRSAHIKLECSAIYR